VQLLEELAPSTASVVVVETLEQPFGLEVDVRDG
jgi:hypothetical protein